MGRPTSYTVGPLASANASNIAAAQTFGSGGGTFLLNGTTAGILDTPRRVLMTNGGNDTGTNFTLTGTDWNGSVATEVLAGTNGSTLQSIYDYATITSITANGTVHSTGATFGTNGVASSRPIFLDPYGFPAVSIQIDASGTVNYSIQSSLDDPNGYGLIAGVGYTKVNWVNSYDTNVVSQTTTQQSNFAFAPYMVRVLLNSGTGSVTLNVIQSASPSI